MLSRVERASHGLVDERREAEHGPPEPPSPIVPDYGGACLSEVVPTLVHRHQLSEKGELPAWLPEPAASAEQIVLLVVDGLGFAQLQEHEQHAPTLCSMLGGAITTVAPTTTATALTSLVTGTAPKDHGVLGYLVRSYWGVLNVLRWSTDGEDARQRIPPRTFQRVEPFCGIDPPVVSRAEFASTGFTTCHLAGARLVGWRVPSSIRVEVAALVRAGEPFVYAYYDGVDKVAHDTGLGEHYVAELSATDRIVSDLLSDLPEGCALVVTADHGQVAMHGDPIVLAPEIAKDVELLSGEGRFRWLHVREGAEEAVVEACRDRYGDVAWVLRREEIFEAGWFGGRPAPELAARLGDVALVAFAPVAFFDPADTGELRLLARHGSLTAAEVLVPLVAWAP